MGAVDEKRGRQLIGIQVVKALKPGETVWDEKVRGFGIRRQKGADVSYILIYRRDGAQRWHTIGKHGAPWTPDRARKEAKRLLGEVVDGADPAADKKARRAALTISGLCDAYLAEAESGKLLTRTRRAKAASTIATDRSRIEGHIRPLLGQKKADVITAQDIETFMVAIADGKTAKRTKIDKRHALSNVRGGQGAASRTIGLLGAIFAYAVKRRIRTDNPVRGVVRPADGKRERRLSDEEYLALGDGIRKATEDGMWPAAAAVARFLALTGWRAGEVLNLTWAEVDLATRTARLERTKTGKSMRPLSHAACSVLASLSRSGDLVFPSGKTGGIMSGYRASWDKIMGLAGLPDGVTPHVLRHSFASVAADLKFSELTIAALIGHKSGSITSKYIHYADAVLLAAADNVADEIAKRMGDEKPAATVVELKRA